jgi:hypothetical protein
MKYVDLMTIIDKYMSQLSRTINIIIHILQENYTALSLGKYLSFEFDNIIEIQKPW